MSGFPVAFRLPAFASRSSASRQGIGSPYGRPTGPRGRTQTGLPRSARTSCDREGCPLYPGDDGAHPGPGTVPGRRLPHLSGNVPAPRLRHSTWQGFTSRGINEGSSNSPVRSSPHPPPPGWNEQPLRLSPELRTPPTKSQTTHVGVGTGQLSTDLEQRSTTSADLQSSVFAHNVRPRRRNDPCESFSRL